MLSSVTAFSPAYHHLLLHQGAASLSTAHLRLEESRSTLRTDRRKLQQHASALFAQEMEDCDSPTPEANSIWMPQLRRIMASIATAGALETAYLSYNKLVLGESSPLCGVNGSCDSVLSGPYSIVPFTDIPLALVGCLAYVTVGVLALAPLLSEETDDSSNRVALTTLTTAMGTFSIFLMTLLFGVLQTTCPFCVFSAACSVLLGMLVWLGGCLPPQKTKEGAQASGAAFLATTMAAVILFMSSDASIAGSTTAGSNTLSFGTSLLAAAATTTSSTELNAPPAITTTSTEREIKLATQLQKLDAKMYGAYWCSHCYDQKQVFGQEAFAKLTYLECSKDGVNSQSKVCKAREVPGYPTWEINGKLYPGEQELDELEDLVKEIQSGN
jgi:uncharacterized membrane protein